MISNLSPNLTALGIFKKFRIMNILFKQSATKQILKTLSHLISSESFASSSVHSFKLMSYLYRVENNGSPDAGTRKFHCRTKSLEDRESDAIRARFATEYSVFEAEKTTSFKNEGLVIAKLGIAMEIVSCLAKRGITTLFPIQRAVLEPAMRGRDMIGCAKTGTGKTLAFGIPIMDKILQFNAKHGRGRNPLALILAPTREHARQVEKEFRESSSLDTICVYGGVPILSQIKTLQCGVDVVVGTPGRIIDLIKRSYLILSEIQFVVLDEADQMLAVGFDEDVEVILDKLPKKRQSMMFSATMPSWLGKLTHKYLEDPETIDLVGENYRKLAEGIALYSIATENYGKASTLELLLKEHVKERKCIVFTQTKHNADRLAYAMSKSVKCEPLHGDIFQNQKEKTLSGFRDGRFNILIATDVAARGLDVPNVDLVIHYEMPTTSEIFVHRSSRTWRPGKKGSAVLIHTYEQSRAVRGLELDIGCKFTQVGENYRKLAEGIALYSIATENYGKASTLELLLKEHVKERKCIVFTQTKHNADRLAYAMSKSVKCEPLHGDIFQNQKEKTLSGFRDGRFNILIATDVAARGLDVPNVDLVIHYEMPTTSEIFVHRSSRTWRPGKKGSAVLIHTYEQSRAVRGLELDIGCKFTQLPKMTTEGGDEDMFAGISGGRMSGGRLVGRSPASFGDFGSLSWGSSSSSSGLNNSGYGNSDSRKSGGFGSFSAKSLSGFERSSNFNKSTSEEYVFRNSDDDWDEI